MTSGGKNAGWGHTEIKSEETGKPPHFPEEERDRKDKYLSDLRIRKDSYTDMVPKTRLQSESALPILDGGELYSTGDMCMKWMEIVI